MSIMVDLDAKGDGAAYDRSRIDDLVRLTLQFEP